jgi:hypothetical protein
MPPTISRFEHFERYAGTSVQLNASITYLSFPAAIHTNFRSVLFAALSYTDLPMSIPDNESDAKALTIARLPNANGGLNSGSGKPRGVVAPNPPPLAPSSRLAGINPADASSARKSGDRDSLQEDTSIPARADVVPRLV